MRLLINLLLLCLLPATAFAKQNNSGLFTLDHYYLQGGTYLHYSDNKDYAGSRWFTSAEAVNPRNQLIGLALFDNSFGQFSQYLYAGKSWQYHGKWQGFHTKLTAGFIHGYRGQFEDKIPFNHYGIAPAIIPGVGYNNGRYGADVVMLGFAGLLFTVGMNL